MLGIFALVLRAIVGVGNVVADAKSMSEPIGHLSDGSPYYMNRKCERFAANGEKLIYEVAYKPNGSVYLKTVGERTGKIYCDPELEEIKRIEAQNEERKKSAMQLGMIFYLKYDYQRKVEITCEISTDKYIARIRGKEDGTYWKFYLPDYRKFYELTSEAEGDKGVQITKEEYDKFNSFRGTHSKFDENTEKWVWNGGVPYKIEKKTGYRIYD